MENRLSYPDQPPHSPIHPSNLMTGDEYETSSQYLSDMFTPASKEQYGDHCDSYSEEGFQMPPTASTTDWMAQGINYSPSNVNFIPPVADKDNDDSRIAKDKALVNNRPSPGSRSEIVSRGPIKTTWGGALNEVRETSAPERRSSRTKAKPDDRLRDQAPFPDSNASQSCEPQARHLPNADICSEQNRRSTHNDIEKRYRTGLNNHFSNLLNVLPQEAIAAVLGQSAAMEAGGSYVERKKISKGDVLVIATNYIQTLERDLMILEQDKTRIKEDMSQFTVAKGEMGGGQLFWLDRRSSR